MQTRVLTLPFDARTGRFDDEELEAFQAEVDIVEASHHFYVVDGLPGLVLVLRYRPLARPASPRGATRPNVQRDPHPRDLLGPDERRRYDLLRDWRGHRSRTDGVASYLVLTNQQIADLARLEPGATVEVIRSVRGLGPAKWTQYGEELKALLATPETKEVAS